MAAAGVQGYHATPKGLRHGFGVAAVQASIPLHLVQRWLGHAQLATTTIYAEAMGQEERDIARQRSPHNRSSVSPGLPSRALPCLDIAALALHTHVPDW
jgi:integrase